MQKENYGENKPEDPMEQIRNLLLRPELEKIDKLEKRFNDRKNFIGEVSRILPEAIIESKKNDSKFDEALLPIVEQGVKTLYSKRYHVIFRGPLSRHGTSD